MNVQEKQKESRCWTMPVSEQEIEIWKTIELRPFDEFYEVSNFGEWLILEALRVKPRHLHQRAPLTGVAK